jgi:hypothetical protein
MTAVTHNITIEQGATFRLSLKWETKDGLGVVTPVNLTSYTARMQVRQNSTATTPVLSLVSPTHITLGADGTIEVEATPTQTAAIDIRAGVYDLELEDSYGRVTRFVQGKVTVSPEVTR